MSDQYNNSSSRQSQPTPAQVNQQNQQNINQTQGVSPDQNNAEQFGNQGSEDRYSYLGPHDDHVDDNSAPGEGYIDEDTAPDGYGDQDQFADVDGQDPYNNLYDQDPGSTPAGEDPTMNDLYGLAEPLAKPGEESRKGSERDRYGTRISQDQSGYQQ